MDKQNEKTLRQKVLYEFSEYMINVVYLSLFFGSFALARRLTLAHFNIYIDDYFVGIIKAMVIGKVIMIGTFLRISRKYENKPLLVPALFKTILFVGWVIVFDVIEVLIKESVKLQSFSGAYKYLIDEHFSKLWLGGLIMVAIAFIPFFALKEISRVMGQQKFRDLLLKTLS